MKRREVLWLIGGASLWPVAARSQQLMRPVVGFLHNQSPEAIAGSVVAFRQGLIETGYTEGENVTIEYRWANGQDDRMAALAAELVDRQPEVIFAGGTTSALAAKAATSTIPIVFSMGADPVGSGLVASFSRPAGNATGVFTFNFAMEPKRLGLLIEVAPTAAKIAVLANPDSPTTAAQISVIVEVADSLGQPIEILYANSRSELDAAFAGIAKMEAGALLVGVSNFFLAQRAHVVAMAAALGLPAIYDNPEFVAAGGLMSYGVDQADNYRQASIYAGRILSGEKPGELPVLQSNKFALVINLRAARDLGITVPAGLLALADEVIE